MAVGAKVKKAKPRAAATAKVAGTRARVATPAPSPRTATKHPPARAKPVAAPKPPRAVEPASVPAAPIPIQAVPAPAAPAPPVPTVPRRPGVQVLLEGADRNHLRSTAMEMAGKLGHALIPVDLPALVSKNVQETEKNLDRMFAKAEAGDAVLFFDEAEALFGQHDGVNGDQARYLNVEVDYLMKRIEGFSGLVILGTNCKEKLEPELLRRLHFVIPL
jgi:hypothetical protein